MYEIYCRPLRATDIMLEPGEQVLEMPILSEDEVWEVGAGVSRMNGIDVQHFFLKPSVSSLITNMIIITDRRVYHLLLCSSSDTYMVMVKWEYASTMPFTVKTDAIQEQHQGMGKNDAAAPAGMNSLNRGTTLVDPVYLSFDYKMSHNIFGKPVWLPQRVYDDWRKTYIILYVSQFSEFSFEKTSVSLPSRGLDFRAGLWYNNNRFLSLWRVCSTEISVKEDGV